MFKGKYQRTQKEKERDKSICLSLIVHATEKDIVVILNEMYKASSKDLVFHTDYVDKVIQESKKNDNTHLPQLPPKQEVVVVVLERDKEFIINDYAKGHSAGEIKKRLIDKYYRYDRRSCPKVGEIKQVVREYIRYVQEFIEENGINKEAYTIEEMLRLTAYGEELANIIELTKVAHTKEHSEIKRRSLYNMEQKEIADIKRKNPDLIENNKYVILSKNTRKEVILPVDMMPQRIAAIKAATNVVKTRMELLSIGGHHGLRQIIGTQPQNGKTDANEEAVFSIPSNGREKEHNKQHGQKTIETKRDKDIQQLIDTSKDYDEKDKE